MGVGCATVFATSATTAQRTERWFFISTKRYGTSHQDRGSPHCAGSGHTTGGERPGSDQVTAIPLIQRNGSKAGGSRNVGGEIWDGQFGQSEQVRHDQPQERRLVLGKTARRRRRNRLRTRCGPGAATHLLAVATGAFGRGRGRRAYRGNALRPHQPEAQQYAKHHSHT